MLIDRLSLKFSGDYIKKVISAKYASIPTRPNFNIQRGQPALVMQHDEGQWCPNTMKWGYGSDRSAEQRIINARTEGILAQPSFRFAIRERRIVVPIDSFYIEAIKDQQTKVYRVVPFNDSIMYLAGIWEPLDQVNNGFTIMTVKSNKDVSRLTDRMPLIFFDNETAANWCQPMNVSQLVDWLKTTMSGRLKYYQVTNRVLDNINAPLLHETVQEHLTLFD